jgi:hypothetical protein
VNLAILAKLPLNVAILYIAYANHTAEKNVPMPTAELSMIVTVMELA